MRAALALTLLTLAPAAQERVVVGSKNFPESHLLGEVLTLLLEARTDLEVVHRSGLGGTLLCHRALVDGEIDLYPEYTGTAWAVVLGRTERVTDPLRVYLEVADGYRERFGLVWGTTFGFENTYVLALRRTLAEELGLRTLSDLAGHPELRAGFSPEFLNRQDGWPALAAHYGLTNDVRAMEHALAYEALAAGQLDVVDAYSTDGKLARHDVALLADDRAFFPPYHAAPVARGELLARHPAVRRALDDLAWRLSTERISALNHRVEVLGEGFRDVARAFLEEEGLSTASPRARDATGGRGRRGFLAFFAARRAETLRLAGEHVLLTLVSVLLAALLAIPLGVWSADRPRLARAGLACAGVLQTVPSLALLAVLLAVPGLGLSARTAVVALLLYALLPILRNTITGLRDVDPELLDAARGLGLTERQTLRLVRLPLATRAILAGVRTATVISVGVATLAAFIGAGGLGEPIVTGLYLNDTQLILSGALPAAALALAADALLGLLERRLTPRGLERA